MTVAAVVFDMDGVLVQSEELWDDVRERLTRELGGRWHPGAQRAMMGLSAPEWSAYMAGELGVPLAPAAISDAVVERMAARYREHLPLIPGAVQAVGRLAARWPLAVASSSNRPLIDLVLERAGLRDAFSATVASEEVARGKPSPDVYVEAARRLGVAPVACAAVEDSHNGLLAARAAGMAVIAIPNPAFPPAEEALSAADLRLREIGELTAEAVEALSAARG